MVNEYLEYRSSSPQMSSSPSSACLEASGADCSHRKLCLEEQRLCTSFCFIKLAHSKIYFNIFGNTPILLFSPEKWRRRSTHAVFISKLSAVYLWAGWWVKLAGAPGPPGSVCTEGSNQCRLPVCSWTGSCQSLTGGAASQGCGRWLDLTAKKKKKKRKKKWIMASTSGARRCTCHGGVSLGNNNPFF